MLPLATALIIALVSREKPSLCVWLFSIVGGLSRVSQTMLFQPFVTLLHLRFFQR